MSATAARSGLLLCPACRQLNRAARGLERPACARCGAAIHARQPASLARTWAYVAAAAILYIPANLLPVLENNNLLASQRDTILSGVLYLYQTGSWPLALIVFVASIVIPAAKLGSLVFLLVTTQRRSTWNPLQRTRLYRATHHIGRWSMVDIYVGTVLVALVQFSVFASTMPGPGAVFFGLVVVLTMLASASFDPRLIWDPADARDA